MTKKDSHVTFKVTSAEKQVLVDYSNLTSRQQSDIMREFLRSLEAHLPARKPPE